jgi:hypothetical protein
MVGCWGQGGYLGLATTRVLGRRQGILLQGNIWKDQAQGKVASHRGGVCGVLVMVVVVVVVVVGVVFAKCKSAQAVWHHPPRPRRLRIPPRARFLESLATCLQR